jgi:hypothetical protein
MTPAQAWLLGLGRGPFRVVHAHAVLTGHSPKMCRVPFYGHLVRVVRQENACTTTLNSGPNPSGHHLEEQSPPQKLKNCIFLEELSPANCISMPNFKSKSHPTKKTEITRYGPHKHKMHFFFYSWIFLARSDPLIVSFHSLQTERLKTSGLFRAFL